MWADANHGELRAPITASLQALIAKAY